MRLVSVALWGLHKLYKPGYNYQKAGVMLGEIVPAESVQTDLFASERPAIKSGGLMTAMDAINRRMGKNSVKLASEGFKKPWKMKQGNKSPSYTTRWDDLPVAVA